MKLTENFSLPELLESNTATRLGLRDQFTPPQSVIDSLTDLCIHILQPLRDELGPIRLSSGYRSPRLNAAVKGASSSQHCKGEAADCNYFKNGVEDNLTLAKKVLELGLPFDQMILEFGTNNNPAWIHLSYSRKRQRNEILRATLQQGRTIYTKVLKEDLI